MIFSVQFVIKNTVKPRRAYARCLTPDTSITATSGGNLQEIRTSPLISGMQSKTRMISSKNTSSYGSILKSTVLVGGSQVISIIIGIIRTKLIAVMLGPSGIGLMGMYQSIIAMVGAVTSAGIGSSGVRQIAEAAGTGNEERIARTIITMRRMMVVLGIVGFIIMMVFSTPISKLTFSDTKHVGAIIILSIALFFSSINSGQLAILRGMRRISAYAIVSVLGAFLGTLFTIPIIYIWREDGIVTSIVAVSIMAFLPSWWYAQKISIKKILMGFKAICKESKNFLYLGFIFMLTGIMSTVVIYLTRVLVLRELGMQSVGIFQAATMLSTTYIGIVFTAMGNDFYPRLTAVADNNESCNRLVNEQIEVGLLLGTPGILATLTFAPYVITIFYSMQFVAAVEVLRWQVLGVFFRVISWPLGFILLAKKKGAIFFWTELILGSLNIALIWAGLKYFGLLGTGITFFFLYAIYTGMIWWVARRVSGFRWSLDNQRSSVIMMMLIAMGFSVPNFLSVNAALLVGLLLTVAVSIYCMRKLCHLVRITSFFKLYTELKNLLWRAITQKS